MNNGVAKLIQEMTDEWFSDIQNYLLKTKAESRKCQPMVVGMKMNSETLELLKQRYTCKQDNRCICENSSFLGIPIYIDERYHKFEIGLIKEKL